VLLHTSIFVQVQVLMPFHPSLSGDEGERKHLLSHDVVVPLLVIPIRFGVTYDRSPGRMANPRRLKPTLQAEARATIGGPVAYDRRKRSSRQAD
jgi:hypothetical protein